MSDAKVIQLEEELARTWDHARSLQAERDQALGLLKESNDLADELIAMLRGHVLDRSRATAEGLAREALKGLAP